MKLNTLRSNKTPILETGCLSNNQNTHATEPRIFYQSGTFLGGAQVRLLLNGYISATLLRLYMLNEVTLST